MKRIYLFLALLLTFVGISVTRALIITVDQDSDPRTESTLTDGDNVVIRMRISNYNGNAGNHQLAGKSTISDVRAESGHATHPGVDLDKITAANVWALEEAETDANGTWWYLKNVETGRYISWTVDLNFDPNNPSSLPAEDDPNFEEGFFNEDGWLNCYIPLTLVDSKDAAKPLLLKQPSKGVLLLGPEPTNENVVDLINTIDETELMLMAKFNASGQTIWATVNSAYSEPGFARYNDWAGYWAVLPTKVEDDPFEEFYQYLQALPIQSYPIGNDPGCVNETEAAQTYNELVSKYSAEVDNDHEPEYWIEALAELKAAIEALPTFTFKQVTPGYYRIPSAKNGNYMFLNNNGDGGCRPAPEVPSLNDLWQIYTNAEGETCMKNLGTMKYIIPVAANSQNMKGDYEEHTVEITCRNTLTVGDQTLAKAPFNIACTNYLHTQGTNLLVWWDAASIGDMWMFETVSTEELQESFGEDILTQLELNGKYYKLLFDAENIVANAKNAGDEMLITDASQISSPKTQSGEGAIANLIDGKFDTYWHSEWSGGDVSEDNSLHYLQFDLRKQVQVLTMKYCRRPSQNDHPTKFQISASNEADGEYTVITEFPVATEEVEVKDTDEEGNYIILSETPRVDENGEPVLGEDGEQIIDIVYQTHTETRATGGANNTLYSYALDLGAEYQYVRVLATMTDYWRGYWHASEMYFVVAGADLWTPVQAEGEALEAAIAAAKAAVAEGGVTQEVLDALQAAYDAFINAYPNPDPLKELIAEANDQLALISAGENPGQKPAAAWNALKTATEAAEAWLKGNLQTVTKAALAEQEQKLQAALNAWYAVAINSVQTDTWYYIQMPNARAGHTATNWYEAGASFKDARIAARYADANELNEFGVDSEARTRAGIVTAPMYNGEVSAYDYNDDMCQWRLIEYKAGLYAIQNKATGNFLRQAVGSAEEFLLSPVPGFYSLVELNGGKYAIQIQYGVDKDGEAQYTYANIYGQGYVAGYSYDPSQDTGSQWVFVVAGKVNEKPDVIIAQDGAVPVAMVLPYTISEGEGDAIFYTELVGIDTEKKEIQMNEHSATSVKSGTPFIAFDENGAEGDVTQFTVKMESDELSLTVDHSGNVEGHLEIKATRPKGMLVPSYNAELEEWGGFAYENESVVRRGAAWIDFKGNAELVNNGAEGDQYFTLDLKGNELVDGVAVVKGNKQTSVYNLNGQRVTAPAKGLYIMNGKKVVVK